MNKILTPIIAKLSIVIFIFLLIYYFFAGIRSSPWEADSLAYHIPIAKLILNGNIINPAIETYTPPVDFYRLYQPGSLETILSILLLANIPINIYNVIGLIALFFALRFLARSFKLSPEMSVIFAVSFSIVHGVIRWVNAQTIDAWLAVFFALSLALLQNPKKSWLYFLNLGVALGMVMGGKYTGPAFVFFLFLIYGKNLITKLTVKNILAFSFPFLILGISWYIRNYVLTGDPYFPQTIPFFKGIPYEVLADPVGKMALRFPKVWFDALISEYTVWSLALFLTPILAFKFKDAVLIKLSILGLLSFVIYFFLPSGPTPSLITSGFRYTYPAFIPLILGVFLLTKRFKRENLLAVVAITNLLILPELSYHPKILLILIPIALLIFREDLFPGKLKV